MIVFEFALPKAEVLTSNRRGYWAKHSAAIKSLRDRGAWAWSEQRAKGVPQHEQLRCVAYLTFADRRLRDAHNHVDTVKPLIDGMITGPYVKDPATGKSSRIPGWRGLLPDDDHHHLIGPDMRIAEPDLSLKKRGLAVRVRLEFTSTGGEA